MKLLGFKPFVPKSFSRILGRFSKETQDSFLETFEGALKICFFKYKRKIRYKQERRGKNKKLDISKIRLKRSDISNALYLIDFHLTQSRDILVQDELAENFGIFEEKEALDYYEANLMNQEMRDIFGRKIVFDEEGMIFLYKERTAEGKHILSPENYVQSRGKRLPWIKRLIEETKEVYRQVEKSWETFLYVGTFRIPLYGDTDQPGGHVLNHFLIIIRKESGKPLRFITAYSLNKRLDLYRHLEPARPFLGVLNQ